MKNATKKKPVHKKKSAPARKKAVKTAQGNATVSRAAAVRNQVQPQSKQQAAKQAGVFLQTDDKWSLAYFDPNDLHCVERELFG